MPSKDVYEQLRPSAAEASGHLLWETLRDHLDVYREHPCRIAEVEEAHLHSSRDGEYYIIKDGRDLTYLKLTPRDYYLWTLMDGTRSVKDLVVAYFLQFGALANDRVCTLVEQLRAHAFLTVRPAHLYRTLGHRLSRQSPLFLLRRLRQLFFQTTIALNGVDRLITALYEAGGRWLFTPVAQGMLAVISLIGIFCFAALFHENRDHLFRAKGSYSLGLLTLALTNVLVVTVHEMAHAFTTKSYGRTVPKGGFLFYFGLPCFFVDVTDIWLEPARRRIAVAWAGPYSGIALGSICSICLWLFPTWTAQGVLVKVAVMGYAAALINLNPLLEFDGYYILMDWLEIPLLRRKSLQFLRTSLWEKLIRHDPFTREEKIFSVFGSLAAVWTVIAIGFSMYLLEWRFMKTMHDLMTNPDWTVKGVSFLVLLVFILPLILSLIALFILVGRGLVLSVIRLPIWKMENGKWHRVEHPPEGAGDDRLEDVGLLRKMPLFAELSPSALSMLESRMRVERYEPGAVIIRTGERGSCFYVVKRGEVDVIKPVDGGGEQTVASLGPGEYFGEIALLLDVPRTATVIAARPIELLVLEKADFEALVADHREADILMQTSSRRLHELQRTIHTSEPAVAV